MLDLAAQFSALLLAAAILISMVRLVRGPTLPDRVVAMDLIGVLVLGLIVITSAVEGERAILDAAIVIAMIGFVGTIAYATYVERGYRQ